MESHPVEITLAMPVFNGSNFIRNALDSILEQDFTNFELIVTDNASEDDTAAIVAEYAAKDPRAKLVRNKKNIGAAANYNLGFEKASGKYLKWCAHDDCLSPNFLSRCLEVLKANPDTSLAFAETLGITPKHEIVKIEGEQTPALLSDDPAVRFKQAIELSGTCFPIFGLFRKDLLARSTLHRAYYSSDRALLAEMAILGKFRRVDDAIFYNREHEQRSINIDDKVQRSFWQTGRKSRSAAAEHLHLARHLFEIASRHGDIVAPSRLRADLIRRSLTPVELSRYFLELTTMISPTAARAIKSFFAGRVHVSGTSQAV